jgi:tRNA U34 5-carboxymethylaminomethyl modifying enzyme MnmG/GidA
VQEGSTEGASKLAKVHNKKEFDALVSSGEFAGLLAAEGDGRVTAQGVPAASLPDCCNPVPCREERDGQVLGTLVREVQDDCAARG